MERFSMLDLKMGRGMSTDGMCQARFLAALLSLLKRNPTLSLCIKIKKFAYGLIVVIIEFAKSILKNARESGQPICIYEISDNSTPKAIWWIAIPFAFLMTFFVTPMVRPMSWQQLVFTYLIPLIPLFIAWDGAVSNARTYSREDIDILLEGLKSKSYSWETGTIKGKGGNKMYLLGLPAKRLANQFLKKPNATV